MLKQRDFPGYATLLMAMKAYARIRRGVPSARVAPLPHATNTLTCPRRQTYYKRCSRFFAPYVDPAFDCE